MSEKEIYKTYKYFAPGYLANAVDDDECGSKDVTVGGVFSHDVFVPQLDWHKGPKQLAQLLDQQVELTLDQKNTPQNSKTKIAEGDSLDD